MKTYVLDASALFAFLQKTPGAYRVSELLKEALHGRARMLMSAVSYGEVYGTILRASGPEQALMVVYAVSPLPIELWDATPQRALKAADVKAKHKLYADSFAAALAIEHNAALVTSDSDFPQTGPRFFHCLAEKLERKLSRIQDLLSYRLMPNGARLGRSGAAFPTRAVQVASSLRSSTRCRGLLELHGAST